MSAKRAVDLLLAIVGLLVAGPLILLLAWLVRRDSPGPALYRQPRLGRFGRPFTLLKLRTMVVGAEEQGAGLAVTRNDPRITRLGAWLRPRGLDELPQLWNVLRGDMSLVGPRPLPVSYLERWDARQRLRLAMPQGLTGWAQIAGRNAVEWSQRLELDAWYVEHWSLWLDVTIVGRTAWLMLTRRGATADDGSVPEFTRDVAPGGEQTNL